MHTAEAVRHERVLAEQARVKERYNLSCSELQGLRAREIESEEHTEQRHWQVTEGQTETNREMDGHRDGRTERRTDYRLFGDGQRDERTEIWTNRDGRTSLAPKHSFKFSTDCVKHYTALQADNRETGQRAERWRGEVNWLTTVRCDYNRCTVKQVEPARSCSYLTYIPIYYTQVIIVVKIYRLQPDKRVQLAL